MKKVAPYGGEIGVQMRAKAGKQDKKTEIFSLSLGRGNLLSFSANVLAPYGSDPIFDKIR